MLNRRQIKLAMGQAPADTHEFWLEKIIDIDKKFLPDWIASTFTNGEYRTVKTVIPITLFRIFGGKAKAQGSFLTTEEPFDISVAERILALKENFGNSKLFYAEIQIPPETVLFIGTAAAQPANDKLPDIPFCHFRGGAEQIVLEEDFYLKTPNAVKSIKKTRNILKPLGQAAIKLYVENNPDNPYFYKITE
ncbi:MAG: hypothetical protein LBJ12_01275 [Oscillospiraceae bacterium]|jgi:hypothetical protein|nr:hypothetical protein [Oscillospiraceae bacterium]